MLLLYTAFCVILLYLSDVSLLNRLLRFLTILRFDVSIPNGYPRFFAISFVMFLYGTFFCVFFTMFFSLFRYAALRYCFLRFTRLFLRFTLWLCTLSDGCAYVSLFADRGSIDHIDVLKCAQRYFFFFNMTKIVPFLLIRRLSDPIVAARFADPLAEMPASYCTAAPSAPQTPRSGESNTSFFSANFTSLLIK